MLVLDLQAETGEGAEPKLYYSQSEAVLAVGLHLGSLAEANQSAQSASGIVWQGYGSSKFSPATR